MTGFYYACFSPSESCPEEWVYFPNTSFCYKYVSDLFLSWGEARNTCKALADQADLATIKSMEEQEFLLGKVDCMCGLDRGFVLVYFFQNF